MRALVCGGFDTLGDVLAAIESADGTLPGSVGRVDNVFDALEVLDGREPVTLFIEVAGAADPGLGQIRALVSRGARVIVLAHEVAAEVRVAAIKAGAREVLFAPWTPARVQSRLAGSTAGTSSVAVGAATDFRAIVLPDGTNEQVEARVTNLSDSGFTAERLSSPLRKDQVVRAAIQVPPPDRLPVLFARVVADASGGTGTFRFVGLSEEEENTVQAVVGRLTSPPRLASPFDAGEDEDPIMGGPTQTLTLPVEQQAPSATRQTLTRVIEEIDGEVLRNAPPKWLGLPLPILTDSERVALVEKAPLADVAVWRTRAHVVASILESGPDLAGGELPWETWRERLAAARDVMRKEVSARMADPDTGALREARDIQARLNAVSDRIDRLARKAGVDVARGSPGPLEAPAAPATFERPAPVATAPARAEEHAAFVPPSGRRIRLFALGTLFVVLAIAAGAVWQRDRERRSVVPERTLVVSNPVARVEGLRVRSTFRDRGTLVIVVDSSWYEQELDKDPGRAAEVARALARHFRAKEHPVEIRDIAGWRLAEVTLDADAPQPAWTPRGSPEPTPRARAPGRAPASPSR